MRPCVKCGRSALPPAWLGAVALTLLERVCTLTTLHPLAAARKLQLLRQASSHLREIVHDHHTGPALALLGKKPS